MGSVVAIYWRRKGAASYTLLNPAVSTAAGMLSVLYCTVHCKQAKSNSDVCIGFNPQKIVATWHSLPPRCVVCSSESNGLRLGFFCSVLYCTVLYCTYTGQDHGSGTTRVNRAVCKRRQIRGNDQQLLDDSIIHTAQWYEAKYWLMVNKAQSCEAKYWIMIKTALIPYVRLNTGWWYTGAWCMRLNIGCWWK